MTRTTNFVLRFLADERPELPARLEILRCFSQLAGWMIVLLTLACFFRARAGKTHGLAGIAGAQALSDSSTQVPFTDRGL